ncbi:of very long chain fatty acids 2 [Octopus vulgaris]|uniref:Elongation of very long chain fatty acids protein n=3 Tax=Octopus TaxID=6643 RepID=A0AA36FJS3_OCTVU|nr:of very long chain fatty acids 2 [Octopus vulgaris]
MSLSAYKRSSAGGKKKEKKDGNRVEEHKNFSEMADVVQALLQKIDYTSDTTADPRTKDWFFLESSPLKVWILTAMYILFVIYGPKYMKNRKPFDIRIFMVLYNLAMVVLSIYMFVEIILSTQALGYTVICAPYTKSNAQNPKEMRLARVLWWYYFSKAIELMDTVLMILRKKNDQVTFLHVFHHATMLNIWWWVMMFIPGGQTWFGACLNCFIHVVMYTYYGLSAIPSLKKRLWWKKYITKMQLIQFCVTFAHSANSIRVNCEFPSWGKYLLTCYMILMIILFSNFYIQAYIKGRRNPNVDTANNYAKKKSSQNGSTINGTVKKAQ